MSPVTQRFDLVVVGAGPTGLMSALLARKLGMSVCIVDKAPSSLQVGRADALNARTQEVLELTGVLSELEGKGLKCNSETAHARLKKRHAKEILASSTFEGGKFVSRQSQWWTSLKHVHRPNFLMIGQADIERELASKLDIPVKYDTTVTKVEELVENGKPFARTHFGDTIVESDFVVGADGARSVVRDQLGVAFTGTKPEMVWAVLDTFMETDFPVCPEIITFQLNGQARISWIPRERGMSRFYVLLDGEITQARTKAKIREALHPYTVNFRETEWFSTFEIKERIASTVFSPNRTIILAGDAAHIHAVNGGQGLNTGISDAFALVWRLKMRKEGYVQPLESYERERLGTARRVIDVAAQLVRSTVRTATEYVKLIEENAKYITGIGVEYPVASPAIAGKSNGIFGPGKRCPDIYFHTSGGHDARTKRLYSMAEYGKFIVLVFSEQHARQLDLSSIPMAETWIVGDNASGQKLEQASLARLDGSSVRYFDRISADGGKDDILLDQRQGAVVIRPDMYIGYAGGDASGYFRQLLSETPERLNLLSDIRPRL